MEVVKSPAKRKTLREVALYDEEQRAKDTVDDAFNEMLGGDIIDTAQSIHESSKNKFDSFVLLIKVSVKAFSKFSVPIQIFVGMLVVLSQMLIGLGVYQLIQIANSFGKTGWMGLGVIATIFIVLKNWDKILALCKAIEKQIIKTRVNIILKF